MRFYLETGSVDPGWNLAFEEYVLKTKREGDWLILWQNRNAVIVGRNQNALAEIDRAFVEAHGIAVVRRNTGGGAVYHDLGNLNYSFITDAAENQTGADSRFTGPVVRTLRGLGLEAESSGRNDILVSGRKVSGTAQHRSGDRILHHGTLLFDSDPEMIAGSLNPDPTKFQSKGVKSVRSRVGNIRSFLPRDMTMGEFWDYLKTALAADGIVPVSLQPEELDQIAALKAEKYDTWQWNYGASPKYDRVARRRFPGGLLELHLTVKAGRIEGIRIFGDFLALRPVESLADALLGCPYRREDLTAVLDGMPLEDHLGTITAEQFLDTLLDGES